MKRMICAAMALLLVGCAAKPVDAVTNTPAPATAETAPAATAVPAEVSATEESAAAAGGYTAMQLPRIDLRPGVMLAEDDLVSDGYYTMCQDGKWGLMKSDGTILLPCKSDIPVNRCDASDLQWHYFYDISAEELQSYNDTLAAKNAGKLCGGAHDGFYYSWTYDVDSGRVCKSCGVLGGEEEMTNEDRMYGEYLPCRRCVWADEGDGYGYYETTDGGYVFANENGKLLNNTIYEEAGCFYDQLLAPVKLDGKWAYIDQNGSQVTEAVYEPVYGNSYNNNLPQYASPLLYGYAAVCRDGKWGVLDDTGAEYIPCEYEYAAWNGHVLWLKQNGEWRSQTLPGVPRDWTETDLGIEVFPKEMQATDRFWSVTADVGLNLRTGPDTNYDKIDKAPEYTCLQNLGHNEDNTWMLTKYAGKYGWVSMEYLKDISE